VRKKFLINIVFLIGLNLLIKPLWILGIDREIQNDVGNAAYGLFFALFNFTFLFQILLDLGITNYNNQSVAKNQSFLAENFARLGALKLGLAMVYLAITLLASSFMGYSEQAIALLYFLTINQFLLSFVLFLRSSISGLQIFWLDSLISVLDRLILIIICSFLLWGNITDSKFQIEWLVYAQCFAYSITLLICLLVVILKAKSFFKVPSIEFIKSTFHKSIPFAIIIFFMTMYFRLDAVMIERLLPRGEYFSGVYAQGYRFFDLLNNFVYLFTAILFPLLSKEMSKGNKVNQLVTFTISLLSISFVTLLGIALFLASYLIEISYDDVQPESAKVLSILLITFIPMVVSSIYGTVLTAGGKLKEMMVWSGVAFVSNILLNFILIPIYGVIGAAIASLVAQSIMATSCYILAGIKFGSFIPIKVIAFMMLPIILVLSILYIYLGSMNNIQIFGVLLLTSTLLLTGFVARSYNEFKLPTINNTRN
jgi:O-antigen/teichoic acid export membrane protein|tara:strand:+ start:612 stop:2057 length:1446 start_codon:yes stop_codon:yes gene_type:complete